MKKLYVISALSLVATQLLYAASLSSKLEDKINASGSVIQQASLNYDRGKINNNSKQQEEALHVLSNEFSDFAKQYIDDDAISYAVAYMFAHGDIAKIVEAFHYVAKGKKNDIIKFEEESVVSCVSLESVSPQRIYRLNKGDWKCDLATTSTDNATIQLDESERSCQEVVKLRRQNSSQFLDYFNKASESKKSKVMRF